MDVIGCYGGKCNLKQNCMFYENKITGKSTQWMTYEPYTQDNNPDTCELFSSKDIYNQLFAIIKENE